MPTFQITGASLPVHRRRAVAVRLTRWLRARGVPAENVVVHFADHERNTIFSGGMPVEALGDAAAPLPHASVVCRIGPDRDPAFRATLAEEIAAALGAGPGTGFLYLEFRGTRPDHVHVWRDGGLRRADLDHVTTASTRDSR
jgi:hypothetical protein